MMMVALREWANLKCHLLASHEFFLVMPVAVHSADQMNMMCPSLFLFKGIEVYRKDKFMMIKNRIVQSSLLKKANGCGVASIIDPSSKFRLIFTSQALRRQQPTKLAVIAFKHQKGDARDTPATKCLNSFTVGDVTSDNSQPASESIHNAQCLYVIRGKHSWGSTSCS